jgi:hypothetical protein
MIDMLKKKALKINTVADAGVAYSDMDNDVNLKNIKP